MGPHAFLQKLRYVKASDFASILKLIASIPYAMALKKKRPHLWLVCELRMEARDNGYWLYKYIREEHPETDAAYVLDPRSPDYGKVARLGGEVVSWGSVKHWAYYLAAEYNISSQKSGKPNAAVCYFLEVYGIRKNTRVFLQHGVSQNDTEFLHYKNTKMRMFVCGARPEYEYVKSHFGYPENYVRYLGLARFDGLYGWQAEQMVLVMPTWRKSIAYPAAFSRKMDSDQAFQKTAYFKAWQQFFEDPWLAGFLKEHHLKLLFYPHYDMQRFLHLFHTDSEWIGFADWRECDVQDLLRRAKFLVTDYSSVAMDFAYMGKPLLYYQFDAEEFFTRQYKRGYFDYGKDGFGPVCETYEEVKKALESYAARDFQNPKKYLEKEKAFFQLHDQENCRRNFEAIREINHPPEKSS